MLHAQLLQLYAVPLSFLFVPLGVWHIHVICFWLNTLRSQGKASGRKSGPVDFLSRSPLTCQSGSQAPTRMMHFRQFRRSIWTLDQCSGTKNVFLCLSSSESWRLDPFLNGLSSEKRKNIWVQLSQTWICNESGLFGTLMVFCVCKHRLKGLLQCGGEGGAQFEWNLFKVLSPSPPRT